MRVISLVVAGFLFLSTFEAWGGFWLAGRWYVSSRFATVSLGTVKSWLDRGIVSGTTQTAKVFIQRNGKWILLTLGLSQVISEVQNLQTGSRYCYIPSGSIYVVWTSWGSLIVYDGGNNPQHFYTFSYPSSCYSGYAYIPAVEIRGWMRPWNSADYQWVWLASVPAPGTYNVGGCSVTFSLRNVGSVCPSSVNQPPSVDWNQRRQVPVRVFPDVSSFVRPDVIEGDPSLRYLRDEYQRLSQDASIPTIPADMMGDLELPSVDWSISPEESLDHVSESSRPSEREGEGSGDISVPGLDTNLNIPERRSFPVELLNSIVQSHPLLRVLQGVSLDVGGGGSCRVGSGSFTFDFCPYAWVLNLMGSVIVFVAFLTGLFWAGRSD
jgi:hypothetical protein